MDHTDALRLVVFEYLLPERRLARRAAEITAMCAMLHDANIIASRVVTNSFYDSLGARFDILLEFSDRLLSRHGHCTSYAFPHTMRHEDERINQSPMVNALVDSDGPYRWTYPWGRAYERRADPPCGLRTFAHGENMHAGRIINLR